MLGRFVTIMQLYTSPVVYRSAARAFMTCSRARSALESVQPEPEIPLEDLDIPVSRRSLASLYGDNRIGSVRLPQELQEIVSALIQGALDAACNAQKLIWSNRRRQEEAQTRCFVALCTLEGVIQ